MAIPIDRVLITDEVDQSCVDILQRAGIHVVKDTKLTKEQLIAEIPNYDGLIVRSATRVTAEIINAATQLKIIGRAGTGVDNIDSDVATEKGIIVMNTPGGNTLSAAEHTCALICSMTREIPQANLTLLEGRWDRKRFMGNELYGKTLGIIGLGRIGKEVALRMQSFGMRTIGHDPIIGGDVSSQFGVEWLPLEKLWPQVDFITVHTPLIPQTTNLINDAAFAACKRGVRVINCARGGIIDEAALLRALQSGQCGGAGLDVFIEEPPKDFSLIKHPKVVATPHLGANTVEAQIRVAQEIAEQFVDLKLGKKLFGAVNANALTNALSVSTRSWVQLGRALGEIVFSFFPQQSSNGIAITSCGEALKTAGSFLSAAVLAGYLKHTGVHLNLINSPVAAKKVGIQAPTTWKAEGDTPRVDINVAGELLSGAVAGNSPVLLQVGDSIFPRPPALEGSLIIFSAMKSLDLISKVAGALTTAGNDVVGVSVSTVGKQGSVWGVVNLLNASAIGLETLQSIVTFSHAFTLI